jgi:hypothetical protein
MPKPSDSSWLALRIATVVWAAVSLVDFTVWAMICIIGGHLDAPWWLWFTVPPGVIVGALWWAYGDRAS